MKGQGNLRKHSVVANQEVIPTGERSGIYPLPRPCHVPLSAAPGHKESHSTNTILEPPRPTCEEMFCNLKSCTLLYHKAVEKFAKKRVECHLEKSITEEGCIENMEICWESVRSQLRLSWSMHLHALNPS